MLQDNKADIQNFDLKEQYDTKPLLKDLLMSTSHTFEDAIRKRHKQCHINGSFKNTNQLMATITQQSSRIRSIQPRRRYTQKNFILKSYLQQTERINLKRNLFKGSYRNRTYLPLEYMMKQKVKINKRTKSINCSNIFQKPKAM